MLPRSVSTPQELFETQDGSSSDDSAESQSNTDDEEQSSLVSLAGHDHSLQVVTPQASCREMLNPVFASFGAVITYKI